MRNLVDPIHTLAPARTSQIGVARIHESAIKQVAGQATYVDDIAPPRGTLHAYPITSPISCGTIESIDSSAVESAPGVVAVLSIEDVLGHRDIGPVYPGDMILADGRVDYHAQPILLVVAASYDQARSAAQQAKFEFREEPARLDIHQAIEDEHWLLPASHMNKGNVDSALENCAHVLSGDMHIGGQEHFYLEGQASLAIPAEDGGMLIQTSSQHPSEVQKLAAEVLAVPLNLVTVEMRRMGGGFGGKETQAAQWACLAALAAQHTGRAVKLRLARSDDFRLTGKRHPFYQTFRIGFDSQGIVSAVDLNINGNCGISPDLSESIIDRAMFHSDNAYCYPNARIKGTCNKLNTVSHTAFRGFGGPQGVILAERMMDDIAYNVGRDPLAVRLDNLYRPGHDTTPYHQTIDEFLLGDLMQKLADDTEYHQRRQAINEYNRCSPIIKKGMALTPVKFGISFTAQHLNQAGALIHIYTDGTIHLNHGGTEMGQGLNTKVSQIVAEVFGVSVETIFCSATRTDKVPNTSPTAASSGTDLNGMAAFNAATTIKQRLTEFLAKHFGVATNGVHFGDNQVTHSKGQLSFSELVQLAYINRISLSENGFYQTPKIHYDKSTARGRPFFYFSHGAALVEVEIDTLTGENRVLRSDILHDVGRSLNPALDAGQIEGAFIQGMGWLTTEELQWNDKGVLTTTGPATYKIPAIGDTPPEFNVNLYESKNPETTVFRSKAVGEPPFMLGIAVWCALRNAVASITDFRYAPPLDPPATPEKILTAIAIAQDWKRRN